MNIKFHKLYILFTLLVLIIQSPIIFGQNTIDNIVYEARKCLEYKRSVYEKTYTFSAFTYDAPEMNVFVDNCRRGHTEPFIVGGSPANPKEFPHIARVGHFNEIMTTSQWFCGGTLISHKYVLTAAHCFHSRFGVVNIVRLGELEFESNTDDAQPQDFFVKRTIAHNLYNNKIVYNDIGLIELTKKVEFTEYILPACLPLHNQKNDQSESFVAIGWGSTKFVGNESKRLLKVTLNRITNEHCQEVANENEDKFNTGINTKSQFCAGSNSSKDTCNGDSGGPLLQYHPDFPCMYYVVGITSTSFGGCALTDIPGVYTNVYNYIDWIRNILL